MAEYVGALAIGPASVTCTIVDRRGTLVALARKEHRAIRPQPGWLEHDPAEIWERTQQVLRVALKKGKVRASELRALGVTSEGGTAVLWDRTDGTPLAHAIGCGDRRAGDILDAIAGDGGRDRFRAVTGRALDDDGSAARIRWLLDRVRDGRARAERGELLAGGLDSWVIWNLTGGTRGGAHVTDPSIASATMLMGLQAREWDDGVLEAFAIPRATLPRIEPSSRVCGTCTGDLAGVPVAGILAAPQATAFAQGAFEPGAATSIFEAGNRVLLHTGDTPVRSPARGAGRSSARSPDGIHASVAYALGDGPAAYCLEASIPATGALTAWLGSNLRFARDPREVADLAEAVGGSEGVVVVPAFDGSASPAPDPSARGVIVGITDRTDRSHIARAALEATAWQVRQVLDAMTDRSGLALRDLRVDGTMTANATLLRFQSDVLGVDVVRSKVREAPAIGAAQAAGLAVGFWDGLDALRGLATRDRTWSPTMPPADVEAGYARWKRAVDATRGWA